MRDPALLQVGFFLAFVMDLSEATASGAFGESALGTAIMLTLSGVVRASLTQTVHLVADPTRFITVVVGAGAPLGSPCLTALHRFGRGHDAGLTEFFTVGVPARSGVIGHQNVLLFDKAKSNQSDVERVPWSTAALQSFVDTSGLGAALGGVRTSSFFAAMLANRGMPEAASLGKPFWQALALAGSGANAEADLGFVNCECSPKLLPAAAGSDALVDFGLRFRCLAGLASKGAMRVDWPARALSARLICTTAFKKSTA